MPDKNWRILFGASFTAQTSLLTTSAFRLGEDVRVVLGGGLVGAVQLLSAMLSKKLSSAKLDSFVAVST